MDEGPFTSARFRVVRCIGRGGTGVVYEAYDRDRGAHVAVKTLRYLQPNAIGRFKNEFRALQDIEHPNLVSFGELLEEAGQLFFTMELVAGVDFLSYVRPTRNQETAYADTLALSATAATAMATAGPAVSPSLPNFDTGVRESTSPQNRPPRADPLDELRLRHALVELGRGLVALHASGKVHRDVKPSNVLVTAEGRAVLVDFGLLVDEGHDEQWSSPSIVGTPHYMAPEQAAGQATGPAADWYAVGVMLYEALTGYLPFSGSPMKVLLDKQRIEPPLLDATTAPADLVALCTQLMRFDPAERPDGETILRRLGRPEDPERGHKRPSTTISQGPPFVGRQAELEVLAAELEACTARGSPGAVLIRGESGVGKSTLAHVFTHSLERRAVVVAGRCFERESVAYKAFDGVLEALARLLARLDPIDAAALLPRHAALLAQVFPVLKRVRGFADAPKPAEALDQRELRLRVFGALRELFTRLARRHPVVIAIDDLQWADADSLALLGEILRPPDAPPLLLIATLRPKSRDVPADAGTRVRALCPASREILLGPLDAGDSLELARVLLDVHGVKEDVDVAALSEEAAGHPLFLDELVRHAADFGARAGTPATALLRLEDVLWTRVSALEPKAREILELVSIAGGPLDQETMTRVADVPPERFARLVSLLRVSNLVRTTGARAADTIEPYHDRVRHAIASRLDPSQRKDIHRALAVAIEGSRYPGQESILAFHWKGAGRLELAAQYAAAAALRAIEAFAFDRAARFYRAALELGHPERVALLTRLGEALANAGRGAESSEAYLAAATDVVADDVALDLRRLAAEQLLISGHIDRGLELITKVLAALGMKLPQTPGGALASLVVRRALLSVRGLGFTERQENAVAQNQLTRVDMCWSVATGLAMVDTIRSADFQTRHLLLALKAGEPTRVALALTVEGGFRATSGRQGRHKAERLFASAHALLARNPSRHASAVLLGAECIAAYQGGHWREALELARRGEKAFRNQRTGAAWQLDTVHFFGLYSLFYLGELRELAVQTPAHLQAATERGDLYAATNLRAGLCNAAWLVRDDLAAARQHLADAQQQWSHNGFHVQHFHQMLGLGNIHLYAGEAEVGYQTMAARWPDYERSLLTRVDILRLEALHLRARLALALARARPAESPRYLREARKLAAALGKSPEPWAVCCAELVRAGVAARLGDVAGARACLSHAALGFSAADMAVFAACARYRLGQLPGAASDRAITAQAEAELRAQTVAAPARFVDMLVPGFEPPAT